MPDEILIRNGFTTPQVQISGQSSSVSVPFTPTSISGCINWSRSDLGITLGTGVATWTDQSGNGNNLVQATGSKQPFYRAKDIQYNNLPSLVFDGTDDFLSIPSLLFGVYTVVIVGRMSGTAAYLYAFNSASSPRYTYGDLGYSMYSANVNGSGDSAYNYSSNWLITATPKTYVRRFDGTHAGDKLRINGSDISLTDGLSGDPGTGTATSTFSLLAYNDGSGVAQGTIAEVIIYNRSLTDGEVVSLENYITGRYTAMSNPLTSWFKADEGITLNSGNVSNWTDVSYEGKTDMAQPTAAAQPLFVSSGMNSLPDLSLSGSTWLYGSSTVLGTTGVTLFGIFKTSSNGTMLVFGMQYNDYHHALFMNGNGSSIGQLFFTVVDGASITISTAAYNDNNPHCFICTYNGSDVRIYVDDPTTAVATGSTSGNITNFNGDLNAIGSSTGAGPVNDRYFIGHISEVGSYSSALDAPSIVSLMMYLRGRAGT